MSKADENERGGAPHGENRDTSLTHAFLSENSQHDFDSTQSLSADSNTETINFDANSEFIAGTTDSDRTQDFQPGSLQRDSGGIKETKARKFERKIPGYEILGELGRGAMGVVYLAKQVAANRKVALKVMLNIDHARREDIERFSIEVQSAAGLIHPNIIQIYEVGRDGRLPFFTQEYAPGGTLATKISREFLPVREAAEVVWVLSKAIAFAHERGIVHRDLKPSNILSVKTAPENCGLWTG